jgi:two-component system, LytTR family, response regulator
MENGEWVSKESLYFLCYLNSSKLGLLDSRTILTLSMSQQAISAFIVDDEFQSRKVISLMLSGMFPEIEIVGETGTVRESIAGIEEKRPQLVFLDVQMQNETGFDLLDKLDKINFEVIFTTAHIEFAVKAFRYSALDYLIKPIDANELESAVQKAKKRIQTPSYSRIEQIQLLNQHLNDAGKIPDKIAIPTPEGLVFIPVKDIIYCHALGNYTEFYMVNEKKITSSHTLRQYDEILSDNQFFRAHKSSLINLAHIKKYLRGEGGTVVMSNDHEIEIARRNKTIFLSLFKG